MPVIAALSYILLKKMFHFFHWSFCFFFFFPYSLVI